jgi:hypothetical protein
MPVCRVYSLLPEKIVITFAWPRRTRTQDWKPILFLIYNSGVIDRDLRDLLEQVLNSHLRDSLARSYTVCAVNNTAEGRIHTFAVKYMGAWRTGNGHRESTRPPAE